MLRMTASFVLIALGTAPLPLLRDLGAAGLFLQTMAAFAGLLLVRKFAITANGLLLILGTLVVILISSMHEGSSIASGQAFFLMVVAVAASFRSSVSDGIIFQNRYVLLLFGILLAILLYGYSTAIVTFQGRLKILSSATTSAMLSSLLVVLGAYLLFLHHGENRTLSKIAGATFVSFGLIFILVIQSRGALISMWFFCLYLMFAYRKNSTRKFVFAVVGSITGSVAVILYFGENLINRFLPQDGLNLLHFLSGRGESVAQLLDSLESLSVFELFLGTGYGSTFAYMSQIDLEVPHNDLLVYFFDGGMIGALLYLFLLYRLRMFGVFGIVPLFFLLNGLHTNMHLWPNLLPATIVLSEYLEKERTRWRDKIVQRRHSSAQRALTPEVT
ncbi:hypothetical protein RYZ20_13030 [Thioclava sp. A2]|nr:hypothetical protein [Thioclava sp. A2]